MRPPRAGAKAADKKPAPKGPHARYGSVEPGDEVYAQHPAHGPLALKVLACGRDGFTGECPEGRRHGMSYDAMLGHKRRVKMDLKVLDQGQEGAIVQDARGQRRYVAGDIGAMPGAATTTAPKDAEPVQRDPLLDGLDTLAKALNAGAPVLFLKAGPVKNGPGLALRDVTDKAGHQTKRWMRTAPEEKKGRPPAKGEAPAAPPASLKHGDEVAFRHGDVRHQGAIVASGADGVTVRDQDGRHHQVRHQAIEGPADAGGGDGGKRDLSADKMDNPDHRPSSANAVEPSGFSGAAHFQQFDKAEDAEVDAILARFPPDTKQKMADVMARLEGVTETHVKHKQDGQYTPERQALHQKIVDHLLPDHLIQSARPAEGEKPTFTILGGRGGSGKSWFKGQVYDPAKAVVLDADEIKHMLPEYEGWNAFEVHEESGEIFDRITQLAMSLGLNIVHDATMKTPKKAVALAQKMKADGYRVEAHYMHLPRAMAAERAIRRFLGPTGRFVPPEVILGNTQNEAGFDQVKEIADAWSFRDNQKEGGPRLIAQGGEPSHSPKPAAGDAGKDGRDGRAASGAGQPDRGISPNPGASGRPKAQGVAGAGEASEPKPMKKALLSGLFFWRR